MTNIATATRHVEDKARVVLDAYLRTALASESVEGVSDKLDAMRIVIGLNGEEMPPQMQIDTLPRLEVYELVSDSDYDTILNGVDQFARYAVAAVVRADGVEPAAAARSAGFMARKAAEILEQYLPDPSNSSSTPIWRVDASLAATAEAGMLDVGSTQVYTMRAQSEILVSVRQEFGHSPTYANPTLTPDAGPVLAESAAITVSVDLTSLASATARRNTTVSVTSAQLAGGTNIVIDLEPATTWPDGSAYNVYLSRHDATVSGTVSTGDYDVEIALATYDIEDGDRWVVTCVNDTTNQPMVWAFTWSVT